MGFGINPNMALMKAQSAMADGSSRSMQMRDMMMQLVPMILGMLMQLFQALASKSG
jgi:hypothetical protein